MVASHKPPTNASTQPGDERTAPLITGADAVVRSLEELGTEIVFGLPGGAVLPLYDALFAAEKLRHVLVRHEQGAGHAAEGYAVASGKVGVCIATSGPGATNLVTPIGDAYLDSVPIVAITGQVGSSMIGTDAFQEADIRGITMPITKHNIMVTDVNEIPSVIATAFHIASSGRPGPVLVDIPKDVQAQLMEFSWPPKLLETGYVPADEPLSEQVMKAAERISQAKRPVLYIGGGVVKSAANKELLELVEATGIPVVTTLMALGAFPQDHPCYMGMPGMHGTVPAVGALQEADLLIAIGTRFDDRVTGDVDTFAPHADTIHADIDPAEIGKIRPVDVPIVGDAKKVLAQLTAAFTGSPNTPAPKIDAWMERLQDLQERFPRGYDKQDDGKLSPQFVIEMLSKTVGKDAIYASGVGQHQMWSAQFLDFDKPRHWLSSGGAGTMGYAVPAAMGAKAAMPDKEVWAVDGDGCFQMTNQEITTAAMEGLPIKVCLINNGNLGMVRQWQTLFYEGNYSHTKLGGEEAYVPDFVKLSEALGAQAVRVTKEEDVVPAIEWARGINDRPVVVEFIVGEDAQVWPMVAAGASNSDMQYALGMRPFFDMEESAAETPEAIHEVLTTLEDETEGAK
ncbi:MULTISPECIES: acetolactate synthase large subunit [Corynebacterium]|uniref:Acetolactate synthase n=1 Tax=Corynebacterium lipophilum TaxID=2804918 RepID=A0AAW5HX45_9CORY|nr:MULTISPECIES: acetolactate synthase large subunit [Corynebacterium]MCO6394808.1 acetolactate synthase large subunit [Corynebacterium lipophilum]MCQ4613004.1 acetolactate synthase large subunit [Corynebacterium sp. CCUG 51687]MCZ2117403.1 acetolactate synthase large subunit [Corynebacterium lipophilum]OFT28675.1 acetolactate synthase large subunit [Corynebacterium sp. HMSC08D02]